jgi:exonuclease VII large subunit
MTDATIDCPKCGAEIPLTEAVSHRVREQLEADFNRRLSESNAALQKREQQLATDREALAQRANSVQQEVTRQVEVERKRVVAEAAQAAEDKLGIQLRDAQQQLETQRTRLKEAQEAELTLRKRQRELEEAKDALQLEVARTLESERQKIAVQLSVTLRYRAIAPPKLHTAADAKTSSTPRCSSVAIRRCAESVRSCSHRGRSRRQSRWCPP